ncbi:chromate transporter [Proteiniborus ethanoligenes]|uniref:Chromate transporter n=1 Tax=Proteiniborus ethanoligenes TaxID=415015 RepID=A0A1H3QKZ6_9FIRM|nr:chromate transporter [Proteiniborus ethanoligenes]SDZ14066.1 chromate transporter [Proteiniborus ethanoligenes]
MIYLKLFITFFKIGLFSFGGGYAMLPLIQTEVVDVNSWISISEFTDIVAISQVTPGPIAVNSATYIGYTVTNSVIGSFFATLGVTLPSVIIMLIICNFFFKFKNNKYVENAFVGLRPVVVGLVLSAMLLLINKETFIDYKSIIFFALAFLATWKLKMNPILITLLAGIAGYFIY